MEDLYVKFSTADNEEMKQLYLDKKIAESYNKLELFKLNEQEILAEYLNKNVQNKNCSIIDFGCGTGLLGIQLAKKGFKYIDGLDYSDKMLEIAKSEGIYHCLNQCVLGIKQFPEKFIGKYDIVTSWGLICLNHAGENIFHEMISAINPESQIKLIIFNIPNPKTVPHLINIYENLVKEGKLVKLNQIDVPRDPNKYFPNIILVFQVSHQI